MSGSTDSVSAKVQVQQYSVAVGDGVVNYGLLALSATNSTIAESDSQVATNDGNQATKLNIMGSNSTPDSWTLAASAGANQYFHEFSTDSGTNWAALTTSYATLITTLGIGATEEFDLHIGVPSTTAATATQDVDLTVQATAP